MNTKKEIRTRFAPSPTGHLHIGNARTAIMNWLFTRHAGGRFVLRIEDTDVERSTAASETGILEDLLWLGLPWDEGPDVGGPFGPYRQSQRIDLYKDHCGSLLKDGKAYPCYCTPEELESRRAERIGKGDSAAYDGRCRELTPGQIRRFESEGRKPAIRFRVDTAEIEFQDIIKGPVAVVDTVGDFVLLRANGMPMYNFSCVVDDHLMEITHVIRGDDHVSNTPRQVLLYRAFGWESPLFAHIPMILGNDRVRLSKRHGATSVAQYRELGYLPEALVNFLSLLSWSSESGDEILQPDRLISEFDFTRVSRSAAVFDREKLDWMNGIYIRNLKAEKFAEMIRPILLEAGHTLTENQSLCIAAAIQAKVERLTQVEEKVRPFLSDSVEPENEEAASILESETAGKVLTAFLNAVPQISCWNRETFLELIKRIQKETGIKGKDLYMPIRVALTGQVHGPELPIVAEFLGQNKCLEFIEKSLKKT